MAAKMTLEQQIYSLRLEQEILETMLELKRKEGELKEIINMSSEQKNKMFEEKINRASTPTSNVGKLQHLFLPKDISSLSELVTIDQVGSCDIVDQKQGAPLHVDRHMDSSNTGRPMQTLQEVPSSSRPLQANSYNPSDVSVILADALNNLADKIVVHDNLPRLLPEEFHGDILNYPSWIQSFESIIERNTTSTAQRLFYLGKCTKGEAYKAIQGYLTLNTESSYLKAKETLQKRYGDKYLLARICKSRLTEWPVIKTNDGPGMRELSDFILTCKATMETTRHLASLNSEEEISKIVEKLPRFVQDRWIRVVDKWLNEDQDHQCYPPFETFSEFIEKEARIANLPGASLRQTTQIHDYKKTTRAPQSNTAKVFAALAQDGGCKLCRDTSSHDLEHCPKFQSLSLPERKQFLLRWGLCFACLDGRHLSKDCKNRKRCECCKGWHPTLMHDYNYDPSTETKAGATTLRTNIYTSNRYSSMIIPVVLQHKSQPNRSVTIYALLDDQSDSTFITPDTLRQLHVKGTPVKIKLTTMTGQQTVDSTVVQGLSVRGLKEDISVDLPSTYVKTIPADRSMIPTKETAQRWNHLRCIANEMTGKQNTIPIGLLIGLDCQRALKPLQVIPGGEDEPWALRTMLGWGIVGAVNQTPTMSNIANDQPCKLAFRTCATEITPVEVRKLFDEGLIDCKSQEKVSVEDRKFLNLAAKELKRTEDGHYELPLPFKTEVNLPDNKEMALSRLSTLERKFRRNPKYKEEYCESMADVISKGYAEPIPEEPTDDKQRWYIPHHGVYHPHKPGKLRVVFDCSADYKEISLNELLLQGPNLTNHLTGVLCRFREEPIALSCDIEGMFNQVRVREDHRNFLQFLWWENGNTNKEPREYRMTTHLFGATSSPGCVNYALKATADEFGPQISMEAAHFVKRNFYVDDGLTSVKTKEEALRLALDTHKLCEMGGFNLHKFVSNNEEVLAGIPSFLCATDVRSLDFCSDSISRTLGIAWCIRSDTLQFQIDLNDKPLTRRGILSSVSSIFDPLGLIAPVTLIGKKILQDLVRDGKSWDDPLPSQVIMEWENWREQIIELSQLRIPRCYKQKLGKVTVRELHHFSDASQIGIGQCSYLRQVDDRGQVACTLVMAKSKVTPSKPVTVPRLELMAAVTSAKVSHFLEQEMTTEIPLSHHYWTDSKVVLGYVHNESKRFQLFVANRIQQIRDYSDPASWQYIDTRQNPADHASRGLTSTELIQCSNWWNGPSFLHNISIPKNVTEQFSVDDNDPEVRATVNMTQGRESTEAFASLTERLERFSSWGQATRAIAGCIRYMKKLCSTEKIRKRSKQYEPYSVAEIEVAQKVILLSVQREHFSNELSAMDTMGAVTVKKSSSLYRLDPYVDEKGLIHVGGRLSRASLAAEELHPIVIPKTGHITELLIRHYHQRTNHSGPEATLNEIRSSGFWIIKGRTTVTSLLWKCVMCRKQRKPLLTQKMSDLPEDRVNPTPPFMYSAVDYFGPFMIREGRSERKRWGVLFTCMASRAVHIEVANSLSTDSFINAYRRFVGRRGAVRQLRCDQGTNFVGATSELKAALAEMEDDAIARELLKDKCDWVRYKMNPPHSSHMGGSWERMIRSIRNVLSVLLSTHGSRIDDEQLHTFMVEAEAIVNSRPITYLSSDVADSLPITPQQLLTLKSRIVLPPPGIFLKEHIYCRKRWRAVQYLADQFWIKWKSQYLSSLQERSKWHKTEPNVKAGDIVLVKEADATPRNAWPLARIMETTRGTDGLVRAAKLKMNGVLYTRPIHKLVLLYSPGTGDPDEEPA